MNAWTAASEASSPALPVLLAGLAGMIIVRVANGFAPLARINAKA